MMSHISVKILAISFFAALFVTDETLDPSTMTAFFPVLSRSVASSGKAASCWPTTSSALELLTTWNMSAAARDTPASTSSLTSSTPRWRMVWRSLSS